VFKREELLLNKSKLEIGVKDNAPENALDNAKPD